MATNGKASPVTENISIASGLSNDDGIDLNGRASLQQNLSEQDAEKQKLMEEYKEELTKIQEDIATLRLVLNDKIKRENELKALLGISFVDEIKHDFAESFNQIKTSQAFQKTAQTFSELGSTLTQNDAYQKTTSTLKGATQKITPAFSNLGGTVKNSIGNLRNSSMFQSFQSGFSSTFTGNKMKTSQSEFQVDGSDTNGKMTTSKSTLGTNGTIPEDN